MTAQIMPMHAGHASDFGKLQTQFDPKMDTSSGAPEPQTPASPDRDDTRGRRRERDDGDDPSGDGGDGGDATGSSRKRRRSRKGLDKKFECPHEGCGKSYSRAEHLYRHQLNRKSRTPAINHDSRSSINGSRDLKASIYHSLPFDHSFMFEC
jgi:hypothetical protein